MAELKGHTKAVSSIAFHPVDRLVRQLCDLIWHIVGLINGLLNECFRFVLLQKTAHANFGVFPLSKSLVKCWHQTSATVWMRRECQQRWSAGGAGTCYWLLNAAEKLRLTMSPHLFLSCIVLSFSADGESLFTIQCARKGVTNLIK